MNRNDASVLTYARVSSSKTGEGQEQTSVWILKRKTYLLYVVPWSTASPWSRASDCSIFVRQRWRVVVTAVTVDQASMDLVAGTNEMLYSVFSAKSIRTRANSYGAAVVRFTMYRIGGGAPRRYERVSSFLDRFCLGAPGRYGEKNTCKTLMVRGWWTDREVGENVRGVRFAMRRGGVLKRLRRYPRRDAEDSRTRPVPAPWRLVDELRTLATRSRSTERL